MREVRTGIRCILDLDLRSGCGSGSMLFEIIVPFLVDHAKLRRKLRQCAAINLVGDSSVPYVPWWIHILRVVHLYDT